MHTTTKIKSKIPNNIKTNFPIRIPRINRIFLILQKKQIYLIYTIQCSLSEVSKRAYIKIYFLRLRSGNILKLLRHHNTRKIIDLERRAAYKPAVHVGF